MYSLLLHRVRYQSDGVPRFRYFPVSERIQFCKRIALFLNAGAPLLTALQFVAESASTPYIRFVTKELYHATAEGLPLSQSLARHPKAFTPFVVNLITIGELSGSLPRAFALGGEHLLQQVLLKRKIASALIYPAIIVLATIGISFFLLLYIFPKMLPILTGLHQTLPFFTKALITVAELLEHTWLFMAILFLLGVLAYHCFRQHPRMLIATDAILLRTPLLGQLFRTYYVATSMRSIAILLRSGISILQSLDHAATSISSHSYRIAFAGIKDAVMSGTSVSGSMQLQGSVFPHTAIQMIRAGEYTGTLSDGFEAISAYYEEELDSLTHTLTALIEPVLMIVMGCIVGCIALAIITPIYSLTQGAFQ